MVHSYIQPRSKIYRRRLARVPPIFQSCRQGADKLFRLTFQNRVEILDVADFECWLQRSLLRLVSITLYHDNPFAQDGSDNLRNWWRLDERVWACGEDVVNSIGICDKHLFGIENATVSDETFVRYLVAPLC